MPFGIVACTFSDNFLEIAVNDPSLYYDRVNLNILNKITNGYSDRSCGRLAIVDRQFNL